MIEEEQEIRKTKYIKTFLDTGKRKNNKKGFKNPSYKNKQRTHCSEKTCKKIDKKNSVDSEKTHQQNKREKQKKDTFKKQKQKKKEKN